MSRPSKFGRPRCAVLRRVGALFRRRVRKAVSAEPHIAPSTLVRRVLYPAMQRAGIPREGPTGEKRTFHSLRHTYAKRALESGRQVTWLSRHLGHSSLKVTTDIYGHWERAERRREAHQMLGVFGV